MDNISSKRYTPKFQLSTPEVEPGNVTMSRMEYVTRTPLSGRAYRTAFDEALAEYGQMLIDAGVIHVAQERDGSGWDVTFSLTATDEPAAEKAALEWYAEQVAACRKITPEGEAARQALDADGGKRARTALEALTRPDEATSTQEVEPVSFAWTAVNGRPYPPYVNLTGNRLRVRGEPSHGEVMPFTMGWIEGPYVSVELPDEAIESLRQAISRRPADDETVERLAALNPIYEENRDNYLALNIRMHTRSILAALSSSRSEGGGE